MTKTVIPGVGHNSGTSDATAVAAEQLKSIIERIERLVEDKQAIQGDISEVFSEAKMNGFDTKVIRAIIKDRKTPQKEREEFEAIKEVYEQAIGAFG